MSLDLVALIVETVQELQDAEEIALDAALTVETPLFGEEGLLDSVGLVAVVVAVEQAIEDAGGPTISLADDRAMSQAHSPYQTIGTLAAYAQAVLRDDGGGDG